MRQKPIRSLEVYFMLHYHTGTAWFDDVVVTPLASAACACPEGQLFQPSDPRLPPCEKCPAGELCALGHAFNVVV